MVKHVCQIKQQDSFHFSPEKRGFFTVLKLLFSIEKNLFLTFSMASFIKAWLVRKDGLGKGQRRQDSQEFPQAHNIGRFTLILPSQVGKKVEKVDKSKKKGASFLS
jgi:hypothetical protein